MSEELVGKYKILGELGKGSMGVVYRAEDPEIGRIVAIKTLRSVYLGADAAGQEALQRFRQEARSAGRLKHPNIVTIFETGRTDSGSPFIVMEYIEGDSLEARLAAGEPMDPLEAIHLLAQFGSAIDYAHGHGIVHRDIKPSNVIIAEGHRPHLLDFGVAKMSDTSLTPAGTVVGTPSYMAPEQIRGETLDGSTDRFAFAVLAYEMLTGTRPFPGHDFMTVVSNIIHSEPLPFSSIPKPALSEFEPVLRKGMSKDREQRYPTCLEFVRALAAPFDKKVDHSGVIGFKVGDSLTSGASGVAATMMGPLPSSIAELREVASAAKAAQSIVEEKKEEKKDTPVKVEKKSEDISPPSPLPVVKEGAGRGIFIGVFLAIVLVFAGAAYTILNSEPQNSDSAELAEEKVEIATPSTIVNVYTETSASPGVSVLETAKVEPSCLVNEGCTSPTEPKVASSPEIDLLAKLADPSMTEEELVATIAKAGELNYDIVVNPLLALAKHPNYKVRIAVLKTFTGSEKFRTREVFRSIVERLEDNEFLVRGFTAKFLGSLQNEAALRLLQSHLPREKDQNVKRVIEEILKKGT
jgi:serine/threonine protein kinase